MPQNEREMIAYKNAAKLFRHNLSGMDAWVKAGPQAKGHASA